MHNRPLTEQYFVSSFISGLKDELRSMVKMMMPATVRQAAEKARLQELTLEAISRKNKVLPKTNYNSNQIVGGNPKGTVIGSPQGLLRRALI